MFKRFIIFLLFAVMPLSALQLSAKVSVLTCSPGDEVYSIFGHTGLRYADEKKGIDIVFSYGYFDFNTPNFAWRFVLGETDYMVGAVSYDDFIEEYNERGSAVVEQVLELTQEQEHALIDLLVINCLPANRVYRYNYFYNNCTTKIRDKIAEVAGSLSYDSEGLRYATFRDALDALTAKHPWYAFGINLLLGGDVDSGTSNAALQFIPHNYMLDLEKCTVTREDGTSMPFVKEQRLAVEGEAPVAEKNNFTPFNVFLLLLLATFVVMLCEVRKKRTYWWFDVVLMTAQGLAGLLLLFMALFSQHPAVGNNWLILLLNPLALFIMPVIVCRARKGLSLSVAWVQVLSVALFFVSAILSLQVYPMPLYFFAVAILARSLFLIYKESICELSRY